MSKVKKIDSGEYTYRGYQVEKSPEKCDTLNVYQWDVYYAPTREWCQRFDTKKECLEWIDWNLTYLTN